SRKRFSPPTPALPRKGGGRKTTDLRNPVSSRPKVVWDSHVHTRSDRMPGSRRVLLVALLLVLTVPAAPPGDDLPATLPDSPPPPRPSPARGEGESNPISAIRYHPAPRLSGTRTFIQGVTACLAPVAFFSSPCSWS